MPDDDAQAPSPSLEAAVSAAREAGRTLLERHPGDAPRRKADGSVVSDADLRADALIRRLLGTAFPGDEILSEEASTAYRGGPRVWVVDPLDGSANYVQGVPVWGVTMALVEDGRPTVAVSHFPTMGLTFTATRGGGAWEGSRRLAAFHHHDAGPNDLVAHCSRTPERYHIDLDVKPRILGCASLSYALVAAGAARASIEATARLWDLAAGWLLVEEAGGKVDTLDGTSPWPLAPGDYGGRSFATLAAVDAARFADTLARLKPVAGA